MLSLDIVTYVRASVLAALLVAAPAAAAPPPSPSAPAVTPPAAPAPTATPAPAPPVKLPAPAPAPPAKLPAPAPAAAPPSPAAAPLDAAAAPASPQEEEMQEHRALGHRLFRLGRYEEAVAAFRRAYEVKADARLLFDIAECYREAGAVDQALFYYDRYLAGWPDAFDRAEVDEKVAELEAMRGTPVPRAASAAHRRRSLIVMEPAAGKPRPPQHAWQRWWFWTAVGVAVLGGIAAGVALSSGSGSSLPPTELGNMRFY